MSIKHLNYSKILRHKRNIEQSVNDINRILDVFDGKVTATDNELLMSLAEESFRTTIVHIREEIFAAVASMLKGSVISVNNLDTNKDYISKCVDLGYLRRLPDSFVITLNKYRNAASHKYKLPKKKELLEFYKDNLKYINQIIEDLDNIKVKPIEVENNEILSKEEEFIYGLIPINSRKIYGSTPKEIVKNYIMNCKK